MSLLVLFAQRMRRMLDMYFSIVRRSAACASRVSESASWITTTVQARTTDELVNAGGRCEGRVRRTFEPLLRVQVHLLRLRNLLEDVLDDHPVVVSYLTTQRHAKPVSLFECIWCAGTHLGVISMW